MRKLHLVGLTTDQKGLIFTARRGSESGGYVVTLDADVLSAIAKAQGRGNGGVESPQVRPGGEYTPGPGAQTRRRGLLTPREIQSRLRAGRSVEDVAEEADVEVEWVERFAVPILAEQAQVVELARTLVFNKPRVGGSSLPLDQSVAWNLLDRGARVTDDVFDISWSAYQLHDQVWMIRFSYRSRGRAQEARWELDVGSGELVARNKMATELAYVAQGARLSRPLVPEPGPEAAETATAPPASPSRARASARPDRPAASPATPEPAAIDDSVALDDDDSDDADDSDEFEEIEPAEPGEDEDGDDATTPTDDADDDGVTVDSGAAVAADEATDGAMADEATPADTLIDTGADGSAAAAGTEPAASAGASKTKARPKPRARGEGGKSRKSAAAKANADADAEDAAPAPSPPEVPFKGVRVSSGRVTNPAPTKRAPTRGLLVSSPRMRGVTGGIAADTPPEAPPAPPAPAPGPAADQDAAPADPSPPSAAKAGTSGDKPTAPAAGTPVTAGAPTGAGAKADKPEPVSTPGGAGVRKAVAQVTSVRVAASRALVARAMLPKPAPPVVSRPGLSGRVNQPTPSENAPLPLRPRPKERPEPARSGPTSPPAQSGRPPLRLQPDPDPTPPPPSPFRRSSQSDDLAGADAGGDRSAEPSRSPFVARPPVPRVERPATARPPVRPAPRPESGRPESGRPESGRPGSGRPESGQPGSARPGAGSPAPRPAAARPAGPRPAAGGPAGTRTAAGRPEAGRPTGPRPRAARPAADGPAPDGPRVARPQARGPEERRPNDRRPNDRRADDRRRPPDPTGGWDDLIEPEARPGPDDRAGRPPPNAEGRPRIAAPPAGDWRTTGGRQKPPGGPPVVPPPTGIDEPRPRRRLRRPRP